MTTVPVTANDSISGIEGVTLYVDNQLHSTLNQPPFNFTVDTSVLTPGSHTLTARAQDQIGNQAEASITPQVSALRVEIISPVNGATVNKSAALVQGKIYNSEGEIGVVVNGALAEVQAGDFAAIVPLQVGQNILTAVATTADGFQVQTSVTIDTQVQQEVIRFTATPASGILKPPANTLDVTLGAEAYLLNPISGYSWDLNGDGTPEISGTESKIVAQYQYPGLYFPRVSVTDTLGNIYAETTIVNIFFKGDIENLLRAKWEAMKAALLGGDMEAALQYFVGLNREKYRQIFTEFGSDKVNRIFSSISEIRLYTLYGRVAGCGAIRIETGGYTPIRSLLFEMKTEYGELRGFR
ncbi:MAG: hypothetical protein HXY46_13255 [Syntrophaceae bacterium]|nr:hypothetical protein [Syntrophaceae bacterium]